MKCGNCGNEVDSGWKVCPFCCKEINAKNVCKSCGKEIDASWKACPFCGEKVQSGGSAFESFAKSAGLSSSGSSSSPFVDFEKQYKMNKEEEERIAKEKAEKERKERLAKEKAEKERIAKEKAEKEKKERLAREKAEREAREREALRRKQLIENGSIPCLSADGKTLTLGKDSSRYSDDNSPLEWDVMERDSDGDVRVALTSRCCSNKVTVMPYAKYENDFSWGNSKIREYLNGEFYDRFFDSEAKKYILQTSFENCSDNIVALSNSARKNYPKIFMSSYYVEKCVMTRCWFAGRASGYNHFAGRDIDGIAYSDGYGYIEIDSSPHYMDKKCIPTMWVRMPK